MKAVLTLLPIFVFCISVPFLIQNVTAENAFSENYNKSQIVLVGKVLSLEQRHNATVYEVQVEDYYKNPQSAKVIAVFGPPKGVYLLYDPTFDVGNRLFLYLKQRDGVYEIQDSSFKLEYSCDASGLVPPPIQTYSHGIPASDGYPTFSDGEFNGNIHKVGNKIQIKYVVHNYAPLIKHATVTLLVNGTNQNKTVFSDQRTVTVPACNGSVPLEWNFTPQRADDYVVQAKVTAGYDTQRYGVFLEEPYVANSFSARENVAGGSLDKTVYVVIDSPLKQFKSGVPINQIQCKENYVVLLKPNREFGGCFSSDDAMKLYVRGWPSPNDSVGVFQDQPNPQVKIVKGSASPEQMENYFPKNILVVIGINNTVTWVNEDDTPSSVTSDKEGLFSSRSINPGQNWTHTFEKSGLYEYHSHPHPWMRGAVIVIPQNADLLPKQEKQDIAWYILQPYFPNPILAVGIDHDGTLVVGIHQDELKKNPNAESYYKKKIQAMIPFYAPIKIQFGHVELQ